jgi:hypothetical protein
VRGTQCKCGAVMWRFSCWQSDIDCKPKKCTDCGRERHSQKHDDAMQAMANLVRWIERSKMKSLSSPICERCEGPMILTDVKGMIVVCNDCGHRKKYSPKMPIGQYSELCTQVRRRNSSAVQADGS